MFSIDKRNGSTNETDLLVYYFTNLSINHISIGNPSLKQKCSFSRINIQASKLERLVCANFVADINNS